jgi:hypothetical protein
MTASPNSQPPTPVLRREFLLPEEDVAALDALGYRWETIQAGKAGWVLVHDWPVPAGFTATHVTAAIRIVAGYPAAALDMIYVHPSLDRLDGRPIPALSSFLLDGKTYQRWSRHYTKTNPWRIGLDDVTSHLRAVEEWLRRAVQ